MPAGRFVAELSTPMMMLWFVPGGMTPPGAEAFNQLDVMLRPQPRALLPTFVTTSILEFGTNGPPTGPQDTNPVSELSRRSSGTSNASTTPIVFELPGALALRPIPRFAKAFHNS